MKGAFDTLQKWNERGVGELAVSEFHLAPNGFRLPPLRAGG